MKTTNHFSFYRLVIAVLALLFLFSVSTEAQEEREDNPTTWKYFKILANADDDSVFSKLQDDLNIDPKLGSFTIVVNILDPNPSSHYVVIGDEADPTALRFLWSQLKKENQDKLIAWVGANKENLNKRKFNYASVFVDALKRVKIKELFSPPKKEREILSTTAYINPYLNFFGGEPLGIALKKSFGFSFQLGTPYSGPLETDIVGANFHLLGAKIGVTTRIKELVRKREAGATNSEKNSTFGTYNNIFGPKLGLQASYVIPFGNFLELNYFTTLDSGDYDPPLVVPYTDGDLKGLPLPNIYINTQSWFNFEFRYPLRTFGSTRAKVYIAKFFGEYHAGYMAREIRVAGTVFDVRLDYTFSSAQRNWQFLFETYISNIAESFGFNSFAMGPSIRLTKTPSGGVGIVTALINARIKLGDFYDER